MKKVYPFCIGVVLLLLSLKVVAQPVPYYQLPQNANWIFGNKAGLKFNGATLTPSFTTSLNLPQMAASVSNSAGALLFTANLDTIWNKNGIKMFNGSGLITPFPAVNPILPGPLPGAAKSVLIVPFVNDTNKYYVFSLTQVFYNPPDPFDSIAGRLYYSVVDMSLNGGLGDVVAGQKGIQIDSMLATHMVALESDCGNLWLVVLKNNGLALHAFEITGAGINTTPVISVCNPLTTPTAPVKNAFNLGYGTMKASSDNKRLAVSFLEAVIDTSLIFHDGFQLYDFDNATGLASNQLDMITTTALPTAFDALTCWSTELCFSPDNSKLYRIRGQLIPFSGTGLLQYDLSSNIPATILASAVTIDQGVLAPNEMRIGPDEKIYIGAQDFLSFSPTLTLHCLNTPNAAGTAAGFMANAVTLAPGSQLDIRIFDQCLGNPTIAARKVDSVFFVHDTTICFTNEAPLVNLTASVSDPSYSYEWDDGSMGMQRQVTNSGTYWVRSVKPCEHVVLDTFIVDMKDMGFNLGDDTVICNGSPVTLEVSVPDVSYLWQDGTTANTFQVTSTGTYSVTITYKSCTASDTIKIAIPDMRPLLPPDTSVCREEPFTIKLEAHVTEGATALWNTGSTADFIFVSDTGTYSVTVSYPPCTGKDSVSITQEKCDCITMMPNAFSPNGDGLNDVFKPEIEPACAISDYKLDIFNRWGQRVFSSVKPFAGWNGFYNGQPADAGTYMFTITYRKGTHHISQSTKGDLVLIR